MNAVLRFGRFEIHPGRRELRVDGRPVALGSRAFDLLLVLVEHRERLLGKDELLDRVWPGLVVEENNLQVQVSALRKLLGPRAIATVPGRGYRFTAEPVVAPAAERAAPTGVDGAAAPARVADAGAGALLLVADDNKVNRLLLARSLELMGHRVTAVDNGRQALERVRAQPFDLLLLDLEMPELDGFGVLEALAADPERRELPVIITSSVEGVAPVARCIELGADDFLHKPVHPVLLKARVGTSLARRRQRLEQRALIARLHAMAAAAPARAAATAPELPRRTQATVLAARLLGLAADDDAAATLELLDACRTLLREAVAGHGGTPIGERGDGLMAVFGHAEAGAADGALGALRAALEMAEMLDVVNAERAVLGRPPARLGSGVATGTVLIGHAGSPQDARLVCVGEAVQRAAALEVLAGTLGHPVLIDECVHACAAGRVATQPIETGVEAGAAGFHGAVHAARTG